MNASLPDQKRHKAILQFHRARRQAAVESILARLSGQSVDLLSYEDVARKLGVNGQSSLGVQQIPVTAIVGSVGRYEDFSRTFLPRKETDEDRWTSVASAARVVSDLPPIEVYKIDESYFVLDGNHRVSIARRQGIDFIDAYVTEIRTRVPLPPAGRPDDLIIAAEYAAFLEYTQLDKQREGIDLSVSAAGQYIHLENHIEAHRFWLEKQDNRDLPIHEAAARWYDDAFLPLVQAVREQGVLRYFPGRTETDFFIWLSRHRAELQNELKTIIAPDLAVARIAPRFEENSNDRPPNTAGGRFRHRLSHLFVPERSASIPIRTWTDDRRLARYSDTLFANITWLLCVDNKTDLTFDPLMPLSRIMMLAVEENALLWVLVFDCSPAPVTVQSENEFDALQETIIRRGHGLGLAVNVRLDSGDPIDRTLQLAYLSDLLVLPRDFPSGMTDDKLPYAAARKIVQRITRSGNVRRPLWILGEDQTPAVVQHVLLIYQDRTKSEEALFIAAYLSERWRVELSLLPFGSERGRSPDTGYAEAYLALHEVDTNILKPTPATIESITDTALICHCDLLVLPLAVLGQLQARDRDDSLINLLNRWPHPILLAG